MPDDPSTEDASTDALARELAAVAEGDPDREVCGFVVVDRSGTSRVEPMRNVVGEAHVPGGIPGDPRHAYRIDPVAHLALVRRLRIDGGRIAAVFHSHLDGPARLSATDVAEAVVDGRPVLPGVDQVVIAMQDGKVREIRRLRWSGDAFVDGGTTP